jgi:hypothetical protein
MPDKINWELINPEGVAKSEFKLANPHPTVLERKTILLRWNGKHNGNVFLDRIGDLLKEKINSIKILKAWEVFPESGNSSQNADASKKIAAKLAEFKPDIVLASQCD